MAHATLLLVFYRCVYLPWMTTHTPCQLAEVLACSLPLTFSRELCFATSLPSISFVIVSMDTVDRVMCVKMNDE